MIKREYINFDSSEFTPSFKRNIDGIEVIQIALPYSNKDGIAKPSARNKKIELIPNGYDLDLFKPGNRENPKSTYYLNKPFQKTR